jgi:hypothetical protein
VVADFPAGLFALHQELELLVRFGAGKQLIACLFGEGSEVFYRAGVSGDNLQYLARLHIRQGLFGAKDRQGAIQAARVDFSVNSHGVGSFVSGSLARLASL